mmetsp:Transcript_6447/g.18959  ORF Transcript_6447/g.18959 Transcript_6447/m.18959 type:complete len:646 (-) Transcript_6447:273-2210(-)
MLLTVTEATISTNVAASQSIAVKGSVILDAKHLRSVQWMSYKCFRSNKVFSVLSPREHYGINKKICTCGEATGACYVKKSGKCINNLYVSTCTRGYIGVFLGAGSTCSSHKNLVPAIDYGACCFHDRQCMVGQESFCTRFSPGYFLGPDTTCDQCPSPENLGACCLLDSCERLPQGECVAKGGKYKGDGANCNDHCHGACCSDSKCEIITETAKSTCQGTFMGVGSNCMPGGCPKKCDKTFAEAETIMPPVPNGLTMMSGDTSKGKDYKDYIPECGATILHTNGLWYNLPSSQNSNRKITVSTCGNDISGASADYDSSLSVYEGACSSLSCVGGNSRDSHCSRNGGGATVSWCAKAGKTYRIFAHGFASYCSLAQGNFTMVVKDDGPCGASPKATEPGMASLTTITPIGTSMSSPPPPTTIVLTKTTKASASNTASLTTVIPSGTSATSPPPPTTIFSTKTTKASASSQHEHPALGTCEILPPGCPNPCFKGIGGFEAYQPFCPQQVDHHESRKYIHCDFNGGCFVKECCDPDTIWNDKRKACDHIEMANPEVSSPVAATYPTSPATKVHPTLGTCDDVLPTDCNNPCYRGISGSGAYQRFCPGNSDLYNRTRYVLCDYHGGCFVNECCEPNTYWNDEAKACAHI